MRAALRRALCLMVATALGGCAQLPFLSDKAPPEPAPVRGPAQFRLEVEAPPELQALLLKHLDLARLQYTADSDGLSRGEIDRLVAAAAPQALALLETQGRFNARVQARRVDDGGMPPLLRIDVDPGPVTRIDRVTIEVQGDLERLAEAGDEHALALRRSVHEDWLLPTGRPFEQSVWDAAKDGVLATLRSNGYLRASWAGTAVQVDAETNSARIFVVADSGALYRAGAVRVTGLVRHDEGAILPLARELTGLPATERHLREAQERMLALGLFESVVIDVDGNAADPAAAPVTVAVREMPLYLLTVGVGVSDDTGAQLTLEHVARRVFDSRWTAINKFQVGPKLNSWQGDLLSHLQPDAYRWLLAIQAEELLTDDETRLSARLRVGRTRDSERVWRLIFGEYDWARLETSTGTNTSSALSANYHWNWRDVNDLRTPTQGYIWSLQGGLGWASGSNTSPAGVDSPTQSGPFARVYGRASGFWRMGSQWWGNARVELGEVFVRQALSVPDTLLFRAGGDNSVRGYDYRSLGPQVNGATVSGTTLLTASVQVERPIFDDQPAFLWALFVDAGNASDGWSQMRPVLGYGVGALWRSPVGPLSLYVAYGQADQQVRLHFSVGVTF